MTLSQHGSQKYTPTLSGSQKYTNQYPDLFAEAAIYATKSPSPSEPLLPEVSTPKIGILQCGMKEKK